MRRSRAASRVSDALSLARTSGGGFQLKGRDRIEFTALPTPEGMVVRGPGEIEGWLLTKNIADAGGGFILLQGSGRDAPEAGRSIRPAGTGTGCGGTHLLGEDGRLFRIECRASREARVDLLSWETPGAYWSARPSGPRAWRLVRTIAGTALAHDAALLLLFAAEVLDSEGPANDGMQRGRRGARRDAR